MSTLKVNQLQIGQSATASENFTLAVPANPNGTIKLSRGNPGATTQDILHVDSDGTISGGFSGGSFKNKIIGGDFTTNPWQRGVSFTNSLSNYTADRWETGKTGTTSVINILKTADSPTAEQAGIFTQHCFHVDVTTADSSMAAADLLNVRQKVEGFNAASFGFGQSGTRYVTLSFWHKHTKTGTYCVSLANGALNRSYVAEYTQDTTNTWEKAIITIPVDTTGTWLYDNGIGIWVAFTVGAGSNFQTTANTWSAGQYYATANQVNGLDNVSNDFKLALIQLEAGSVATPFEARSVGSELALCQRYLPSTPAGAYLNGYASSAFAFHSINSFIVQPRVAPTGISASGTLSVNVAGTTVTPTTLVFVLATLGSGYLTWQGATGMTAGWGGAATCIGAILWTGCEL